jgi:hypothetical protein
MQTLSALESFASFGYAIPVSALPYVFTECFLPESSHEDLNSCQSCVAAAQRCLLQIVSESPEALHNSLPSALRRFKEMSAQREVVPGDLLRTFSAHHQRIGPLFATLRDHLKDELLQRCGAILHAELSVIRTRDSQSVCSACVAELIFLLVESLGLAKKFDFQGCATIARNPTFDMCVATLVFAAIQEMALKSVASVDATFEYSEGSSKLANAISDLEEFDLPTEGDVIRLLAYHWPRESETVQDVDCKVLEKGASPEITESFVARKTDEDNSTSTSVVARKTEEDNSTSTSELPWFAEYVAVCDTWRCRICAQAGGRNPYAKGIAIKKDQVALRMRVHSKAAVHRNAAEATKRGNFAAADTSEKAAKRTKTQQSALGGA